MPAYLPHQSSQCEKQSTENDKCPSTPPPSPTPGGQPIPPGPRKKDSTLVNLTIFSVDEQCPEFHTKYDGVCE